MARAQRENMEAINAFFRGANAKNPKAAALKTAWAKWYDDLGWWETGNDDGKWLEAKTKRSMFNAANGETERGMSYEQSMKQAGTVDKMAASVSDTKVTQAPAEKAKAEVEPIRQSPPVTMITLRLGAKGEAVKKWQGALGDKSPDGFFGKGTETKTKAWQKSKGLKSDGVVGPATWAMAFVVKRDASKDPASVSVPSAVHDARGELPSVKTKTSKQNLASKRVAEIEQGTSNPRKPIKATITTLSNSSIAKGLAVAGIGAIAIGGVIAVSKSGSR